MLYKKYHRIHVRKFKRKLSSKLQDSDWTCFRRGVFIDNSCIIVYLIQKTQLVFSRKKRTITIVKYNGELNKEVDNVIQEISQKPCKAV